MKILKLIPIPIYDIFNEDFRNYAGACKIIRYQLEQGCKVSTAGIHASTNRMNSAQRISDLRLKYDIPIKKKTVKNSTGGTRAEWYLENPNYNVLSAFPKIRIDKMHKCFYFYRMLETMQCTEKVPFIFISTELKELCDYLVKQPV